ncbi:MAG: DUF4105 domain-containing protein [Gemmataceae bacterium]
MAILVAWSAAAVYMSNLPSEGLRIAATIAFLSACVACVVRGRTRKRIVLSLLAINAAVIVWFNLTPPSNDRDWKPPVAVLANATIDGDKVTIRNIRNIEYRSESDFTVRHYDKTFDLAKLESVDLVLAYWSGDTIAHMMVSFGFGGDDFVCFSIERREDKGDDYSTWKGAFHQCELIYVVADERDVLGVRTNIRKENEQVYLYRTRIPLQNQRLLFLDYLRTLNRLANKPEWYNTVTDNCTTGVLLHTESYGGLARYNWKLLLSGYAAEYVYEIGGLDTSMPLAELKKLGHVNARAQAAGLGPDFSRRIRKGLPMPAPLTMEELRAHKK